MPPRLSFETVNSICWLNGFFLCNLTGQATNDLS